MIISFERQTNKKVPRLSIIIYIVVDNTKTNKKVLKQRKSVLVLYS